MNNKQKKTGSKKKLEQELWELYSDGRFFAISEYIRQKKIQPKDVPEECCTSILKAMNVIQSVVDALPFAKYLLSIKPKYIDAWLHMAGLQTLLGRSDKARKLLEYAQKIEPDNFWVLTELGLTYELEGDYDSANKYYQHVIACCLSVNTIGDGAYNTFNRVAESTGLSNEAITLVEQQLLILPEVSESKVALLFVLAKDARKKKNTEREIEKLKAANKARYELEQATGTVWRLDRIQSIYSSIKSLFSEATPGFMVSKSSRKQFELIKPLFILGMPRSGTTLSEQIMGAHPEIGNTGESRATSVAYGNVLSQIKPLNEWVDGSSPVHLQTLTVQQIDSIAKQYVEYQSHLTKKTIFTDKNLSNIFWVGFFANLFPNAKFVYVFRHPLDTCVSILQQNLSNVPYSVNPKHIFQEYIEYRKMMEFWRGKFPDRVLFLNFDDMLNDFEVSIKRVIDFFDIDWNPVVLEFYKRKNSVRTPSTNQIRQPIKKMSDFKWKSYVDLLGDTVEEFEDQYQWLLES